MEVSTPVHFRGTGWVGRNFQEVTEGARSADPGSPGELIGAPERRRSRIKCATGRRVEGGKDPAGTWQSSKPTC